jgi:hypothetical protein
LGEEQNMADKTYKNDSDPISEPVRHLVTLFADNLRELQFPGVDANTLTELVEKARAAAADVDETRAKLEAAQETLGAAVASLHTKAEQGLAYAKVYAAGDPSLTSRLASIKLGGLASKKPAKAKQKGASDGQPGRKRAKKEPAAASNEAAMPAPEADQN